jgi:hypothetical protein
MRMTAIQMKAVRKRRRRRRMYYLSLTASRSMRMTAIQMKAVRKRRRRMVVRGSTSACTINTFHSRRNPDYPRFMVFIEPKGSNTRLQIYTDHIFDRF